ncbi:MAG TPA: hypothetical protein V6C50_06945 [Crinalium sp.]
MALFVEAISAQPLKPQRSNDDRRLYQCSFDTRQSKILLPAAAPVIQGIEGNL